MYTVYTVEQFNATHTHTQQHRHTDRHTHKFSQRTRKNRKIE